MNDDKLDQLFGAARQAKPDTARLEYAFETRLLARLRAGEPPWFAFAWKLVPAFAAVVVALGVWLYLDPGTNGAGLREAIAGNADAALLVTKLSGE